MIDQTNSIIMEISSILPENERNSFPDPMQHIGQRMQAIASGTDFWQSVNDGQIKGCGNAILRILREKKSRIPVKNLATIYARGMRDVRADTASIPHLRFLLDAYSGLGIDEIMERYALTAMKLLANDGFIKLSNAGQFENREVLQYHATAQPEFRSGKFQV